MSLDDLVESYFANKDDSALFDLADLNVLYEEMLEELQPGPLVEEKDATTTTAQKFVLSLPKFTPSEAWGDPTSEARQQLDSLFRTVGGGASLQEKLKFLERLQRPESRIRSPRRIISTLILMESLASCVNSFGASTAGFIFEGFLAGLLGGHQVAETEDGSLPIEDIVAFSTYSGGQAIPMSLKLLKKTTIIKGSYTNLVDALAQTAEKYMVYLNESIRNLFVAVQDLSNNVNAYFITKKRGPAIQKGNEAIINAQTIETEMSEQTKDTADTE
jgi:hypothetical protein